MRGNFQLQNLLHVLKIIKTDQRFHFIFVCFDGSWLLPIISICELNDVDIENIMDKPIKKHLKF